MVTNTPLISTTLSLIFVILFTTAVHSDDLEPYSDNSFSGFELRDLKAKKHSLTDYLGKVVLINFWASWCPPCIEEIPELKALNRHFKNPDSSRHEFEVILVNVGEEKNKVSRFSRAAKIQLPVLLDPDNQAFDDWGINILPTSFLVDHTGKVRYIVRGNPGWAQRKTLKIIEQLLID